MRKFILTAGVLLSCLAGVETSNAAKISEWAISPIDAKNYPRIYNAWGAAKVKELNKLQQKAAEKAAKSPECDTVDIVALSETRSIPKQKAVFFVDCANGKRFYISDADLKESGGVVSQEKKMAAYTDAQAIEACKDNVRSQLNYPSTFNLGAFSTSVYRAPTNGNIVVNFDFEAKNGLGAELPHKARCVIDDQGINPAEISRR
ncbi:MAG: hypothetical protein ACQEQL_04465 [Pseudomonadota bacterium]